MAWAAAVWGAATAESEAAGRVGDGGGGDPPFSFAGIWTGSFEGAVAGPRPRAGVDWSQEEER